ncbi:DUF393 domain-containing protein [Crocinitomicaceae bacterium CZZ-1]|uniref:DUF393 domain-containing protein n=1 Tax=Taishania pollutisoli TaxID=2766479 RepID=A0A8J6PKH2_9FLAO|nr:DCC1-like thiol-disulfide oxidoreductase family protein [Taishania pollutisoli]MBC9813536.1 DUF393 domain-containing protein [Taishania pollutisoli]MBX2949044.1 DUF393 domain-containing protein [Crocinitomicaceae bacterium]
MDNTISDTIIFYDGDCGLCNRSVQFVLKHERHSALYFCALQSTFAESFFQSHHLPSPDLTTVYFFEKNHLYQKSEAAFKIIPHLKWYWQPLRVFSVFPRCITNRVYDFIARRRKQIGGTFCVIPSQENKKRFIS